MSRFEKFLDEKFKPDMADDVLAKTLNRLAGKGDKRSKDMFETLYEELIKRLSSATPESQKAINNILNNSVKARLLEDHKKHYNNVLTAVDIFAGQAIKDFDEKREWGEEWGDKSFYSYLPEKFDLNEEMKTGAVRNIPRSGETSIYHPSVQIEILSKLKKSLLTNAGDPLPNNSDWTEYRAKTLNVMKELDYQSTRTISKSGKPTIALTEMMSESSPHLRAFFDAVNRVCEWLGCKPYKAFDPSKVQEFKHRLFNISSDMKVDNPLEVKEESEQKIQPK